MKAMSDFGFSALLAICLSTLLGAGTAHPCAGCRCCGRALRARNRHLRLLDADRCTKTGWSAEAAPSWHDYGGFALNEAGRLWALSYDPSRVTLRHHQCDAYVTPYQMRATGNFRAWEERDPHTQRLVAIHWWAQITEGHRVIWMDGRPHPPAWAPHTFRGFSTGKFVGNALVVTTTHMKQGWLRRNGTPESDQATVTEFFVRHGDHLTNATVVSDPVFLTEPDGAQQRLLPSAGRSRHLALCVRRQRADRRPRARTSCRTTDFGKQPYAREYRRTPQAAARCRVDGRAVDVSRLRGYGEDHDGRARDGAVVAGARPCQRNQQGGRPRAARRRDPRPADSRQRLHARRRRRRTSSSRPAIRARSSSIPAPASCPTR